MIQMVLLIHAATATRLTRGDGPGVARLSESKMLSHWVLVREIQLSVTSKFHGVPCFFAMTTYPKSVSNA